MSKFLLNLLVQISKALVYSKIKFYSEKNFPHHFWPIRPFGPATALSLFFPTSRFPSPPPLGLGLPADPAHPHGPIGHLLPPPAPMSGTHDAAAGRPRAASTVAPSPPPEEKKTAASIPIISPINRRHFPSSITGNRHLQRWPLKLLQRWSLKTLDLASAL
jgi:hypothetical protein